MKNPPIKRSQSLLPLSREHHHGLLLCWKIRTGLKKNIEIYRINSFVDWFYQENLKNHFEIEEDYIFPVLGQEHELIKRALSEHQQLQSLFEEISKTAKTLELLTQELEKHIRFEERVLFPEIEKITSEKKMNLIIETHNNTDNLEAWQDEFWK